LAAFGVVGGASAFAGGVGGPAGASAVRAVRRRCGARRAPRPV